LTVQFRRMRGAKFPTPSPRTISSGSRSSKAPAHSQELAVADELRRIHEDASVAHISLASKLAQHNGLRQFGADFGDRAPPLELRMLLPELEDAISKLLRDLQTHVMQLGEMDIREDCPEALVRAALEEFIVGNLSKVQQTFDEQRRALADRAAASPLYGVAFGSPGLSKRLAAMRSPTLSAARSPEQSNVQSPRSPCSRSSREASPGPSPWLLGPSALGPCGDRHPPVLDLPPGANELDMEMVVEKLAGDGRVDLRNNDTVEAWKMDSNISPTSSASLN